MPTLKHNASSQVLEIRGKMFMIDCGEGTQLQLRRSHIHFTRISAVFISHLHGDHCFGLIGMISTFGMLGRTQPLHVYAPKEMEPLLKLQLEIFCDGLEYDVVFHAVNPNEQSVIYEDRSLTVETIPLEHRIPCCGYLFREKESLPHINREMLDFYDIPLSQVNNIKLGAGWKTADGQEVANSKLVIPADPPRSYAYCSDTRFIPDLSKRVENVSTLYHESTYSSENENRARMFWHSTARQAATVAKNANVGKLLLGHFSARYDDESGILNEARQVFPNSFLTNEGLTFDV